MDPYELGNVLADYADAGGGVVLHQFCFGAGWNLQGRMMDEYSPLSPGSISYTPLNLGEFDDSHPLMEGVSFVSDIYASYVGEINGGQTVAFWEDGTPFVAYNPNNNVVAINGYVGDYRQFSGDMIIISHNAVVFSSGGTWLNVDPRSGSVNAGQNLNVTLTLDATDLESGQYTGSLTVTGYDMNGLVDEILVPVTFNVDPTGVEDNVVDLPTEFGLSQNYPNPFNPTTEINFALPENSHVTLEVFNVLGQRVLTLIDSDMKAGYQSVTWNGKDNQNQSVSSGIYLYVLKAGENTFTKKMMMLK